MDEPDSTQWTAGARERYAQRTQELIAALSTHVAATATRAGRQRELELYERSCEHLHEAANAFNEAEFDWCGSFPLPLDLHRCLEDQEDDDEEAEWTTAINAPGAVVVSLFGRWDWVITDADALLAASRNAYRELWTDDTAQDAELAVPDASSALRELTHAGEWPAIPEVPGLLRGGSWMMFTDQGSVDEESDEINPFRAVTHLVDLGSASSWQTTQPAARSTDDDLKSAGRVAWQAGQPGNDGVRRLQMVSDQPQSHLLRPFAQVVTEEMAREREAAGVPNWEGRLLSEVLDETGGRYEMVLEGFPDRVLVDLQRQIDVEDDPIARRVLETGRLVVPFENLRGLDPATTRVALGFGFDRRG